MYILKILTDRKGKNYSIHVIHVLLHNNFNFVSFVTRHSNFENTCMIPILKLSEFLMTIAIILLGCQSNVE